MDSDSLREIDFLRLRHSDTSSLLIGEEALRHGVRIDGRRLNSFRKIAIEFVGPSGHVLVSFGNTLVFCAVGCEIVEPSVDRPTEGFLYFNVEIAPFTSQTYDPGKMNEEEQFICYFIEKIFKDSGALDVESLCITSGKHVWLIRTSIHVLQNDGNLLDACACACVAALAHFRRNEIKFSGESVQVFDLNQRPGTPLVMYQVPILVCVSLLNTLDCFILDVNTFEENIVTTQLALLFNQFGDLYSVQKLCGGPITTDVLQQAIKVARPKAINLYKTVKAQIDEDLLQQVEVLRNAKQHYSTDVIVLE